MPRESTRAAGASNRAATLVTWAGALYLKLRENELIEIVERLDAMDFPIFEVNLKCLFD